MDTGAPVIKARLWCDKNTPTRGWDPVYYKHTGTPGLYKLVSLTEFNRSPFRLCDAGLGKPPKPKRAGVLTRVKPSLYGLGFRPKNIPALLGKAA